MAGMQQQESATPEALGIINFLRNSSQVPLRNGLLNGKRYPYFHGTRAVAAMLSPQYQKTASKAKPPLPVPKTEQEAEVILHNVMPYAFFLRVERGDRLGGHKKPDGTVAERMRELKVVQQQMFKKEMHYAWFYEGSQLHLKIMGFGMVAILLAGVMFPLWPPIMRLGVWYLSIGLLGLVGAFFVLAIVRLILWGFTKLIGKPWWLFPNLFADVGVVESFIPLWDWDVPPAPKKSSRKARANGQKAEQQQQRQIQSDDAPEHADASSSQSEKQQAPTTEPNTPADNAADDLATTPGPDASQKAQKSAAEIKRLKDELVELD